MKTMCFSCRFVHVSDAKYTRNGQKHTLDQLNRVFNSKPLSVVPAMADVNENVPLFHRMNLLRKLLF